MPARRSTTARSRATARLALLGLTLACGCSLLSASDEESAPPPGTPPAEIPVPPPAPPNAAAPAVVASESRGARAATKIERVTIEGTPPTTRVVLTLDGAAEPEVSLLVNQRLVIDVPGTTCEALPRVIEAPPNDPLVERVRTGQHAAPAVKSRVVVDLRERADFTVRSQDQRIVVLLAPPASGAAAGTATDSGNVILGAEPSGDGRAAAPAASAPIAVEPPPTPEPAVAPAFEAPPPAPVASPAPLEATTSDATRAWDEAVAPFAAAEPLVEATPAPAPAPEPSVEPVPPSPAPSFEPLETAAPAELAPSEPPTEPIPSPLPVASPAAESAPAVPLVEATRAAGRISIDFTEADVRTVIDLIAAAGGYRVIFTPEVAGTVSITLVDRPWEDALDTVLRAKQLREVRHEDVMLVSPAPRNGAR